MLVYLLLGLFMILVVNGASGYFKGFTFFYGMGLFMLLVVVGFMAPFPSMLGLFLLIMSSFAIFSLLITRGSVGVAAAVMQMGFIYYLIMAWFR